VLTLTVDHPAWAAQLRYLATDLLARIHAETGAHEIQEVRISTGPGETTRDRRRR
jgi:hypothetical protein